jgi:hypothetical protein
VDNPHHWGVDCHNILQHLDPLPPVLGGSVYVYAARTDEPQQGETLNQITMATLYINRRAFAEWYFDHETKQEFFFSQNVLHKLVRDGEFRITLQEILNDCGYIPSHVVADGINQELEINKYNEVVTESFTQIKLI